MDKNSVGKSVDRLLLKSTVIDSGILMINMQYNKSNRKKAKMTPKIKNGMAVIITFSK
jgi:hypothetical protein